MYVLGYFVILLMAPIILALIAIGNLTALIVVFKGQLEKVGPVLVYKCLFISDTLYMFQILQPYFQSAFNLNLGTLSRLSCKLYTYFNFQGDSFSPLLLTYISLEKYS